MANRKVLHETAFIRDCFERYYAMGESRTIRRVASEVHKSARAVLRWSDSFHWAERVRERDRLVAEEVAKKTIRDIAETKIAYRKILKVATQRFLNALLEEDEDGKPRLKITSFADFDRAVRLDLLLMNQATDSIKVEASILPPLTAEDREALKKLTQAIIGDIDAAVTDADEEKLQQKH